MVLVNVTKAITRKQVEYGAFRQTRWLRQTHWLHTCPLSQGQEKQKEELALNEGKRKQHKVGHKLVTKRKKI